MEQIKLLVFDIDETLVDRSKLTVEDSAKAAINLAKSKGYEILIATGRSFFFIVEDVRKNINSDYYVTVNGASLNNHEGTTLNEYAFKQDTLIKLIDYARSNDYPIAIKYANCMKTYTDHEYFVNRYCGLDHPSVHYISHDSDDSYYNKHNPLGVFYYAPHETFDEVSKMFPDLQFFVGHDSSMEAIKLGVDKTFSIEDVLDELNITWDNVMAFGDGFNDILMLKKAKIGVAMGNASDEVKQNSDYVTDNILDDGISKALKHFNII